MTKQAGVGLIVLVVVAGLLLCFPGQRRRAPVIGNRFHLVFMQVGGLREGDPVKVAGVPQGVVESIDFASSKLQKQFSVIAKGRPLVVATVALDGFVSIPVNSTYSVVSNLKGERWVEITPAASKEFVVPGDTVFNQRPSRKEDQLSQTLHAFKVLSDQTRALRAQIADPAFRRQVKDAASNFRFYSRELKSRTTEAPQMLARFEKRLDRTQSDALAKIATLEQQLAHAKRMLRTVPPRLSANLAAWNRQLTARQAELESMIDRALVLSRRYRRLAQRFGGRYADRKRLQALVDEIHVWSRKLDDVTAVASDLHALTSDPAVQHDLKGMVVKLKARSDRLKARLEKLEKQVDAIPLGAPSQ